MAIAQNVSNILHPSSVTDVTDSLIGLSETAAAIGKKASRIISNPDEVSPDYIRDTYTNGFISANDSQFVPNFFARAFDEPTYLTFRVEFIFDDPQRNLMYNNDNGESPYYAKMYDYLPEPFLQESPRDVNNGETTIGTTYSTEYYLQTVLGEPGRANMLRAFKLALKDIQNVFPFYLKSISGISSLNKINPTGGVRVEDGKITITCLEGLDLKITQLLQLYRKIVWDDVYQRWILPDMMRYFSMKIYVSEIRLFHHMASSASNNINGVYDWSNENVRNSKILGKDGNTKDVLKKIEDVLGEATVLSSRYLGAKSVATKATDAVNGIVGRTDDLATKIMNGNTILCNSALNKVLPTICFDCHMCEFDISDTMGYLDSFSASTKESKSPEPKLVIKVGQVEDTQIYPLNAKLKIGQSSDGTFNEYAPISENMSNIYSVIMSDTALNKRIFTRDSLADLVNAYTNNLKESINANTGSDEATIIHTRMTGNMRNNINRFRINLDNPYGIVATDGNTNKAAVASLATDALNEMTYSTKSRSTATNITKSDKDRLNDFKLSENGRNIGAMVEDIELSGADAAEGGMISDFKLVGDTSIGNIISEFELVDSRLALTNLARRIFEGEEIISMATSDFMKSQVAEKAFNVALDDIYSNTKSMAMKSLINEYKNLIRE